MSPTLLHPIEDYEKSLTRTRRVVFHPMFSISQMRAPSHPDDANALIKIVRESTERFKDVAVAQAEGYELRFGCVSGPDSGAMGMHFVNFALVGDGELDATRPEIVIYEPLPNGRLKLIGADYLVLADSWNTKHAAPPQLMGRSFTCSKVPIGLACRPFTRSNRSAD